MNYNELKVARIRRNLTSKYVAKKLKWAPSVYCYKENGTRKLSVDEAQDISKVLKLSPAEILLIFFNLDINDTKSLAQETKENV